LSFLLESIEKYLFKDGKESSTLTIKVEVRSGTVLSFLSKAKKRGITVEGLAWGVMSRNFCSAFLTTSCSSSSVVVFFTFILKS
jgi:hypothetical protein